MVSYFLLLTVYGPVGDMTGGGELSVDLNDSTEFVDPLDSVDVKFSWRTFWSKGFCTGGVVSEEPPGWLSEESFTLDGKK